MKRDLQKLFALIAILFVPFFAFPQERCCVLNESFEDGIPADWTQESLKGAINWTVESGSLSDPADAFSGNSRIAFRNITGTTLKEKTKLVLPPVDLTSLYRPILVFAHAQAGDNLGNKWIFDTLKVYFRTSVTEEWTLLKTYDSMYESWHTDTFDLNGNLTSYQIAFEAVDNNARGIVLDDIQIRATPTCYAPELTGIENLTNVSADITWYGDASAYELKISDEPLTVAQLRDDAYRANVMDTSLLGYAFSCSVEGLTPGKTYYYYLRSVCDCEPSSWASSHFVTSHVLITPYTEKFNDFSSTPGGVTENITGWFGNTSDASKPYINTGASEAKDLLTLSLDTSYVLCFNGADVAKVKNVGKAGIQHGASSYIAMPPFAAPINTLYMTFKTIRPYGYSVSETNSIIVGVMSNTADKSTFVPVDTVRITSLNKFEECAVSFANYQGDGKHITFMSDFPEESNVFYIDDLFVDVIPAYKPIKVGLFKMEIPTSDSIGFHFNVEYDSYEVLLAPEPQLNLNEASGEGVIRQVISNHGFVKVTPSTEYFVYARAIKDTYKGEWSDYNIVRTPGYVNWMPYDMPFTATESDPTSWYVPAMYNRTDYMRSNVWLSPDMICHTDCWNKATFPNIGTVVPSKGVGSLILNYDNFPGLENRIYAVLPEMLNPKQTRVSFYASAINTSGENTQGLHSVVIVGVMSDANDISTFQIIDTISPGWEGGVYISSQKYFYYYDLVDYNVNGKYLAFLGDSKFVAEGARGEVRFDDVKFAKLPSCTAPSNFVVEPSRVDPSTAALSWDANGSTSWEVRVSSREIPFDSVDLVDPQEFVFTETVTTSNVLITGLRHPDFEYFYTVRPTCAKGLGDWTYFESFRTECYEEEPLPYFENFECETYVLHRDNQGRFGKGEGFEAVCMTSQQMYYPDGHSYWPHLAIIEDDPQATAMAFQKLRDFAGKTLYAALPKMSARIDTLQVSFKMKCSASGQQVVVGVMSDPIDTATITEIAVVKPKFLNEWREYIVPLEDYKGTGKHIVIYVNDGCTNTQQFFIDDIVVDYLNPCARPDDVRLLDVADTTASIRFKASKASKKWRMVFATRLVSEADLVNPQLNDSIVKIDTVEVKEVIAKGLTPGLQYYLYIQPLCGEDATGIWSEVLSFTTRCAAVTPEQFGVHNFDGIGVSNWGEKYFVYPNCWVVGNKSKQLTFTDDYVPYVDGTWRKSGNASLYIRSNLNNDGAYAITPRINTEDISKLLVRFNAMSGNNISDTYAHSIVVGVVTDPLDIATFVALDTLLMDKTWLPFEVCLNRYTTDFNGNKGQYVMFRSEFGMNNDVWIDDVQIDTIPDCYVNFETVNITDKSVELNFTSGADSYQVKYATAICTDAELNQENVLPSIDVTGNNVVISNLTPRTDYYIYARAKCGETYSEWSVVRVVRTLCPNLLDLPFFENFDNQKQNSGMPECWFSNAFNASEMSLNTSGTYSGSHCMIFRKANCFVTPEINVSSLSLCQVSMQIKPYAYNKVPLEVWIGVVSDLNDIAGTFVAVDSITIPTPTGNTSKWQSFLISLEKYKGTGKYIAFTNRLGATFYLDDILIETIPTCAKVSECNLIDLNQTTLTFELKHPDASSFEIKYGKKGFDSERGGETIEFNGKEVTISGLEMDTEYDVYVRALCSKDDRSAWKYCGTYTTVGDLIQVPYTGDFEDSNENSKWKYEQYGESNKWYIGTDRENMVNDTLEGETGKALYISCTGGNNTHYNAKSLSRTWAYRSIELLPGNYVISFDWTCVGLDSRDYIRAGLLPYTSTFKGGSHLVTALDGSDGAMTSGATPPTGWIELSEKVGTSYRLNGSDTTKTLSEQWTTTTTSFAVTPDKAGVYNLVFFWFNRGEEGNDYAEIRSAVVDNISIQREGCSFVYDVRNEEEITASSTKLTWTYTDSPIAFNVIVNNSPVNLVNIPTEGLALRTQVETNSIDVTGLNPSTTYFAYVQGVCGENDLSPWSEPFVFTTACLPVPLDSVFDFDNASKHDVTYSVPTCFSVGHESLEFNEETAQNFPHVIRNVGGDAYKKYSRSGEYALCLERYNHNAGGYVVLPLIEADLKELQLNFWMRSIYEGRSGYVVTNNVAASYSREVTVGTMTDPNDPSTFTPLATIEYSRDNSYFSTHNTVTTDPSRSAFWEYVSVPLKNAVGSYIAIKNTSSDGLPNNVMYIDDMEVTAFSCPAPMNVSISDVKSTSAVVNCQFEPGVQYKVLVDTKYDFKNAVEYEVQSFPYKMENLQTATEYYYLVRTVCEGDAYASSPVNTFVTSQVLPYHQNFVENLYHCPDDWQRATAPAASVQFAKNEPFTYSTLNTSGGWSTRDADLLSQSGLFSTSHISLEVYGYQSSTQSVKAWLFSPVFELTNDTNQYLTFDLALSALDADTAIVDSLDNDDRFMVIVSEDAGKTWKEENATIWGTATDDYIYKNIPLKGTQYYIDLGKYAGKQIQVAFYGEANQAGLRSEIHLDNVRFNLYTEKTLIANLCAGDSYKDERFDIKASELEEGKNQFTKWEYGTDNAIDTLHSLDLWVNPVSRLDVTATICEGDVYSEYGFSQTDAGEHIRKLKTINGCDSFIVLNLTVIPLSRSVVYDTICAGNSLMWGDQECTQSGEYNKVVPSTTTICDSVVTLMLTVLEARTTDIKVNLCYGDTYVLGDQEITETGRYVETFVSADGCDSIVTVRVTALPDYRQTINAVIKKGQEYNGNGFNGLTKQGEYTLPLKSVDGCDSTIILNLTVLSSDTTYVNKEITTNELPYEYETLYYDETTEPGTYVDTLVVTMEDGSEFVIVHTLTIVLADAIDNVTTIDLQLVPNPVKANNTLYINAEFSSVEKDSLVVEVFNSIGQKVYSAMPIIYPIEISELNQRGVYIVRVVTGNGTSYQGKVIVE